MDWKTFFLNHIQLVKVGGDSQHIANCIEYLISSTCIKVSKTVVIYVVVQYYPWFKLSFVLFHIHYCYCYYLFFVVFSRCHMHDAPISYKFVF